jgi:GT2 family glycosyltransferase
MSIKSPPPQLSIIVVSYKRLEELLKCIDDLSAQEIAEKFEIVLVLQGYSECQITLISQRTKLIESLVMVNFKDGIGVHAARNTGIRASAGSIIAFVDDDCRIPIHWARLLLEAFNHTQIGGVGGFVRHPGLRKSSRDWLYPLLGVSASRYRIDWGGFSAGPVVKVPKNEQQADWLSGCNMSFRRAAMDHVGDFDTEYGKYGFDDVDYCLRIRQAGYIIRVIPALTVDHYPSVKNRIGLCELIYEEERRRVRFVKKAIGDKRFWRLLYLSRFSLHLFLLGVLALRNKRLKILVNGIRGSWTGLQTYK